MKSKHAQREGEAITHKTRMKAINVSNFPSSSPTTLLTAAVAGIIPASAWACGGNETIRGGVLGGVDTLGDTGTRTGTGLAGGFPKIAGSCDEDGEGESGLMHLVSHAGQFLLDLSH